MSLSQSQSLSGHRGWKKSLLGPCQRHARMINLSPPLGHRVQSWFRWCDTALPTVRYRASGLKLPRGTSTYCDGHTDRHQREGAFWSHSAMAGGSGGRRNPRRAAEEGPLALTDAGMHPSPWGKHRIARISPSSPLPEKPTTLPIPPASCSEDSHGPQQYTLLVQSCTQMWHIRMPHPATGLVALLVHLWCPQRIRHRGTSIQNPPLWPYQQLWLWVFSPLLALEGCSDICSHHGLCIASERDYLLPITTLKFKWNDVLIALL